MNMILQVKAKDAKAVIQELQRVLSSPGFLAVNIDYAVKFLKNFYGKVKELGQFE